MPRPTLWLCLASALLGAAAATVWWQLPANPAKAQAEELPRIQNPTRQPNPTARIPLPDRTADATRAPIPIGPARNIADADELTIEERVTVAVYESCNRSVVNISTTAPATSLFLIEVAQEGAGSGSVVDQKGHILTNYHVVDGAREIQVTLFDGKSYPARLVGRDTTSDVAILKIDAPADSLFPVQFGDSSRLKVGQRVFAIGNPFGLERTLTTGVVSSLNRALPVRSGRTKSFIQLDAAINPGNSGGPLLDSRGRLIGMNTAIASKTGQSTGVGFAIPSSVIARVVPELIAHGHVTRPEPGIIKVFETERGLQIATLAPGGPAEQAGLRGFRIIKERKKNGPFTFETQTVDRNSDLITGVNGQPTRTADEFLSAIDAFHPGDEVTLNIIRDGRETAIRLRLAAGES